MRYFLTTGLEHGGCHVCLWWGDPEVLDASGPPALRADGVWVGHEQGAGQLLFAYYQPDDSALGNLVPLPGECWELGDTQTRDRLSEVEQENEKLRKRLVATERDRDAADALRVLADQDRDGVIALNSDLCERMERAEEAVGKVREACEE